MIKKIGIKKFGILLIVFLSVSLLFSSCGNKSSSLTGTNSGMSTSSGSSGSSALSVSGTVNGGLSPISGASVSLMEAGSASSLSTATTNSNGQFTLTIPSSASGILYIEAVGGSTNGGANNNNIQLLAFVNVGTPSSSISNLVVNELTTTAFMEAIFHFGMVSNTSGTITFTSPANTAAQTNAVTQYDNMVTTSGTLNTSSTNLTSSDQNSLYFAADALASCVENSSNCSTLMTDAGGASTMMGSLYNLLNTPSETAGLTTLASGMETSTGWSFSSTPTAVSFILPSASSNYTVGNYPEGIAIDSSGNVWVANEGTNMAGSITKLSSSGTVIGTFPVGTDPQGIAIDPSGNVWVVNGGNNNVTELNSSGGQVTGSPFPVGSVPHGIAIDSSGNVWVANEGTNMAGSIMELSSSGTVLGTFPVGNYPYGIAIDSLGNIWVTGINGVTELSSSGTVLGTFLAGNSPSQTIAIDSSGNVWMTNEGSNVTELNSSGGQVAGSPFPVGNTPVGIAIDASGNVWVTNEGSNTVTELNSSGTVLGTFPAGNYPYGIAIDSLGNIWVTGFNGVTELKGITVGPQFFPYHGPQYPGSTFSAGGAGAR